MITTDEDLSYQISDVRKTTEKSKVQYLACFFHFTIVWRSQLVLKNTVLQTAKLTA